MEDASDKLCETLRIVTGDNIPEDVAHNIKGKRTNYMFKNNSCWKFDQMINKHNWQEFMYVAIYFS